MKKGIENKIGARYKEFHDWTYCPQNKSWYEDGVEDLPQPVSKSDTGKFDIITLVGVFIDPDATSDDEEEINDFVFHLFSDDYGEDSYDYSSCWTQVHFVGNKRKCSLAFCEEGIIDIVDMIKEMVNKDHICFFIESSDYKFVTWKVSEKLTRLAIYDYCQPRGAYLKSVLDITAEKELIIKKFESIIENWKEVILDRIHCMEKIVGKKFVNTKKIPVIDYFFPQFKADDK